MITNSTVRQRCRSNVALVVVLAGLNTLLPAPPPASSTRPQDASVGAATDKNGRIAYTVFQRANGGEFFASVRTVRPDGSRRRMLPCATPTAEGRCRDADPVYSQDGRRLATSGFETPGVAIRASQGRILRGLDETGPVAWSPGRRYLALASAPLRLFDLRDGRSRRLGGDASNAVAWSRQGTLLFGPSADRGDFVVREPSGRRSTILRNRQGDAPIDWAPSGRRFAYTCDGVCVARKDGGKRRLVTRRCSPFGRFAWSPDGQQIACASRLGLGPKQRGLIAINVRTKRLRVIVRGGVNLGAIDWQPLPRR